MVAAPLLPSPAFRGQHSTQLARAGAPVPQKPHPGASTHVMALRSFPTVRVPMTRMSIPSFSQNRSSALVGSPCSVRHIPAQHSA